MLPEETILESFKRGEDQAKKKGVIGAHWLEHFGFKGDPFIEEMLDIGDFKKTFANRTEILEEVGEYIGGSKYVQNFYHIGIVGPTGSGKSSILRLMYSFAIKDYNPLFYDIKNEHAIPHESDTIIADRLKDPGIKCTFFDNCYPIERLLLRIKDRKRSPGVLLTALTPINALEVEVDRQIKLPELSSENIIQLLMKRVDLVGSPKVFPGDFYETIGQISMGNPLLALHTAKEIAKEFYLNRNNKEQLEGILEFHSNRIWAARKITTLNWDQLTTKEREILQTILRSNEMSPISPSELKEKITGGRTLAWKYLERLTEKNLLTKYYRGRTTFYKLEQLTKLILEKLFMEEIR